MIITTVILKRKLKVATKKTLKIKIKKLLA